MQEEDALLNEIELTGQAYDEMQEQNDRLLQQLSSKDDANFKLMSDRINANQTQVLLRAQIDELEKQVSVARKAPDENDSLRHGPFSF